MPSVFLDGEPRQSACLPSGIDRISTADGGGRTLAKEDTFRLVSMGKANLVCATVTASGADRA